MNQIIDKKQELKKIVNLLTVKKYDEVISISRKLIKKFPNEYVFYNALGMSLINIGEHNKALEILDKAFRLDENNIHVLNNLGLVHGHLGNYKKANDYYDRALKIKPNFLNAMINLSQLKEKLNLNNDAIKILKNALEYYPEDFVLNYTSANIYQFLGDFKNSHLYFKKALSIKPDATQIYRLISMSKKFKKNDKDFEIFKKMLNDKNLTKIQKMHLYFALGKALDDIKDFSNSFTNYKKGNDIKDKLIKYTSEFENQTFSNLKKNFKEKLDILSFENTSNKKIIFIVGMPRSGTSLIEQVLSSHEKVAGAGELPFFADAMYKEFSDKKERTKETNNYFYFDSISNKTLDNVKNFYLDKINQLDYPEEYVVDKAPLNFKWIGFIKKIFPNSYIVNCNRNPMDICWSNYKQNFTASNLAFSYNLKNLAEFYNMYIEYMNFWKKTLGEKNILNIQYENFTENFEDEVKKLLNFCDLNWSTNCVEFYKSNNSVATASLAQVRQPIYKTSVASWKNYSPYLEDLKKNLKK